MTEIMHFNDLTILAKAVLLLRCVEWRCLVLKADSVKEAKKLAEVG